MKNNNPKSAKKASVKTPEPPQDMDPSRKPVKNTKSKPDDGQIDKSLENKKLAPNEEL